MTTLYDLFPKKDGVYADELTYNVAAGYYYLLYFNPDGNEGNGEFVDLRITRRDIREAKKAYDSETDDVRKLTAFISSISENCVAWICDGDDDDFERYADTYVHHVYTSASGTVNECVIFFGLSTTEERLDLDEAERFVNILMYAIEEDEE